MTTDEKDRVIDFLKSTRPPVTDRWLVELGFENIGTGNMPLYRSPPQSRCGPVSHLFVDPLMGCDGWSIGYVSGKANLIQPPDTKQEAMLLFMGLGLDLPLFKHEGH